MAIYFRLNFFRWHMVSSLLTSMSVCCPAETKSHRSLTVMDDMLDTFRGHWGYWWVHLVTTRHRSSWAQWFYSTVKPTIGTCVWCSMRRLLLMSQNDSRMSPDLSRGTSKSIGGDLDVDDECSEQCRFKTRAITTSRLRWLPTCAHTNWPCQEGYVPTSKSRTQARIGKNNPEL
jgi:hypothetical protein